MLKTLPQFTCPPRFLLSAATIPATEIGVPKAVVLGLTIGICLLGTVRQTEALEFNEVARFSIGLTSNAFLDPETETMPNPSYIGNNPIGVAWNGSKLYVAGFDNGASVAGTALIEITNATDTGEITEPTYSPVFGQEFPPSSRGYTALAIQGDRLAASFDDGASDPNGIQLFDTATNTQVWSADARGGSGVAFDPGFPGGDPALGAGVAWTTFGSGRRALLDTATGNTIYDTTDGVIWLPDGLSGDNFPRDLAFDPDTGDMYFRRNNDVTSATRNGDNSLSSRQVIVDNGENGVFQLGQHIEFMSGTPDGDLLIYNDRPAPNAPDLPFLNHVKVVDTAGVEQTINFNLLGGLTGADIANGNAIYDFSYDAASGTLALLDFFNRNVFIFEVGGATTGLVGDYNGNNVVDAADYTLWRDTLGDSVATNGDGADGNSNGVIDAGDYEVWKTNFGMTTGSGSGSAVPEPTSLLLLLSMLLGWSHRRR